MIFGIGVDLCEINRLKRLHQKYGDKFARKLLTPQELQQFHKRKVPEQFLASRFCAKEAAVKALGTGFSLGIGFHDIEISNKASGQPTVIFYREAKKIAEKHKIENSHISISDEKTHVVATVVLETA